MRRNRLGRLNAFAWLTGASLFGLMACQSTGVAPFPTELEMFESGGEVTVADATSSAYALPAANLGPAALARHIAGDAHFEAKFVTAPAPVNPGLGPVFNNHSCLACHKGDGGGRAPEEGGSSPSMLFRLSLPGETDEGGPVPVPGFGGQLQDQAVFGVKPEARVITRYTEVAGSFADGTPYSLRRPAHSLEDPYQPLPAGVMLSARLSSPVFGLGLLEAVPESAIVALEDPSDRDGDGITGKANRVWDVEAKAKRLGRFGWKANTPTLKQQLAAAYQQDMGITNPLFPQEASAGQPQAPAPGPVELSEAALADNVYYVRTLGVPARRNVEDPASRRGAQLFREASCAACHAPTLFTGESSEVPELAYQTIHPYTDLLLHDMGPGLADGRPDFLADGQEWRTAPLWGLGLRKRVQGHEQMLHDGRARNAAEAILWHGGEAEKAKEAFRTMSAADREALLTFLRTL